MPDLSAQLTNLRTSGHTQQGYLSVYKGAVAATFTVNVGYTDADYPLDAITGTYTTGSASDVGEGFLCEVRTSGGSLRGITRTRYGATQTATSLKIRELSRGEIVIANGDVITIRREVRLSDLLVAASAGFEPDLITYTDQGSAVIPMPNSGGGWAGFVDTSQSFASVPFFGSLSYTLDPDSSGTLSHLWTIPSGGGSFQAGSTSASADPVIEFNVGCWLLTHTVTDSSNSKSVTQYIPVCVHDTGANAPIDVLTQSLSGAPESGWTYSCRVFEDADLTNIPDGSLVFFWLQEQIAGTVQSFGSPVTGRSHIKMMGYIRRETETSDGGNAELTFDIISPLARLGELPGFSKVMLREASPNAWGEIIELDTFLAQAFLLLFYCNWNRAGKDFIKHADYTALPYPILFLNKDNPLAQIRELARSTDARIVCNRHGRMELQPVLHLMDRTTRNGLDTILTLIRSDWAHIDISREHVRPVETVRCSGFTGHATDPTPIFAKWPGDAPGQGNQSDTIEKLIYLHATTLYARTGLHGAFRDGWFVDSNLVGHFAPRIRLTLPGSYDVFDFYAEWVQLNITTTLREIPLTTFRFTVQSITVTYSGGTATTEIELQAETFGEPGVDDTPDQSNTTDLTDPSDIWGSLSFDIFDGADLVAGTAHIGVLFTTSIAITTDFNAGTPTWVVQDLTSLLDVSEVIDDGVQDPNLSTRLALATTTKLRILDTVTTTVTDTSEVAFTYAVQASTSRAIQWERQAGNEDWIPVLYWRSAGSGGGLIYEGSSDGGVTLDTPVLIGSAAVVDLGTGGVLSQSYPALYVDPHTAGVAYTCAIEAASGNLRFYKTTDFGATWAITSDYLMADWGCGAGQGDPSAGLVLERPFQDTSFVWTVLVDNCGAAQSSFIGKHTAVAANIVPNASPPFTTELYCNSAIGGYEGSRLRRGLRTCDVDVNKLLVITNQPNAGACTDNDIWISLDGTTVDNVLPNADYAANTIWSGGVLGGGSTTPVYLWGYRFSGSSGVPIGYVPNIANWTAASDVEDKSGSGFPASGLALNLFGF